MSKFSIFITTLLQELVRSGDESLLLHQHVC